MSLIYAFIQVTGTTIQPASKPEHQSSSTPHHRLLAKLCLLLVIKSVPFSLMRVSWFPSKRRHFTATPAALLTTAHVVTITLLGVMCRVSRVSRWPLIHPHSLLHLCQYTLGTSNHLPLPKHAVSYGSFANALSFAVNALLQCLPPIGLTPLIVQGFT